ncbi:tetratricopeptide repeat protein [Bartonella sp. F02]|uniref:tetratricopeptide repeat protein n=1 Tax=Bartonella sp. F02 TaxID=2967262 RepID=UPI0022A98B6C|nr:tetratricopeptide repeat protein [Bartonella sp. F02]MCZ2328504.1 tetratricopeptide repeat protein [Bartonella sp. F02]
MQLSLFDRVKRYKFFKSLSAFKVLGVSFVVLMTYGIYSLTGNPSIKSYFFKELMDKDPKTLNEDEKLVRLQTLFLRTPHDGKIADALAIAYLERNRFQDAVNVYLDVFRLNEETAPRLVGYGLALVGNAGGVITQEAQNAFQKAADLSPNDFYPRLFLADALRQAGKSVQAVQFLQDFLNTMPQDSVGRVQVENMIIQLQKASH